MCLINDFVAAFLIDVSPTLFSLNLSSMTASPAVEESTGAIFWKLKYVELFKSCCSLLVPILRRVDSRLGIHFEPMLGLILKQKLDDQSSISSIYAASSHSLTWDDDSRDDDSTFSTCTTLVEDSGSSDSDCTSEATYLISIALVFNTSAYEGNPSFEQDNAIRHALRLLKCGDRQPRPKNWRLASCMCYTF